MMRATSRFGCLIAFGVGILLPGCTSSENGQAAVSNPAAAHDGRSPVVSIQPPTLTAPEDHGHKPGQHGGILISIGRDSYHAEAIFEKGGWLRLYTLGKDESRVVEIERQTLMAFVLAEGSTEAVSMELQPAPQPGDTPQMTSQFLGRLPPGLASKRVEITIPNLRIGEERFRLAFRSAPEASVAPEMPAPVSQSEEQELYFTPGGKYTPADIQANGNAPASRKYQGIRSSHDVKAASGEKLCPISATKANPRFTWVIGGKTYEFCCPPCVDEFVKLAKESPQEVKDPEAYRKP